MGVIGLSSDIEGFRDLAAFGAKDFVVHAYGLWDFEVKQERESHVLARAGLGPCNKWTFVAL